MISGIEALAVQFIFIVLIVLALVFLLLIIYTVYRRIVSNRNRKRYAEAEEYVLPLIYSYADKEIGRKEFSDQLRNQFDIVAAFRNINSMIETLRGEEQKRLRSLLELTKFKSYYLRKLRSSSHIDLAQTCLYFEKKSLTDRSTVQRLSKLQYHDYSVIGYASTLALINSTDQETRDQALEVFLKRPNNASMAISDIVYKYDSNHKDKSRAADNLMQHAADPEVPVKTATAVIRMFPVLGYYQLTDALYELFTTPLAHDQSGLLRSTLIDVLDQFSADGMMQPLIGNAYHESEYQQVRLATAKWISDNYSKELDEILLQLEQTQTWKCASWRR